MTATRQAELKIGGMSCVNCARAVERALRIVPGVVDLQVSLAGESARVTYDPGRFVPERLSEALEKAGYQFLGIAGASAEESSRPEAPLAGLRLALTGLVAGLLLMAAMLAGFGRAPGQRLLLGALGLPLALWLGGPIFRRALRSLRRRSLDMDVMYGMGMGAALLASLAASLGMLPDAHHFLFYDTVLMLASFLTLGKWLEARARRRTLDAVRKLAALQASTARVEREGREIDVPAAEVQVGDRFIVRPGTRLPADGVVEEGQSSVDESMMSGEPLPVFKEPGAEVNGGTLNRNGVLRVRATRVGADTQLAQVIRLVHDAQFTRPPAQKLADRLVAGFIPAILGIAMVSFLGWLLAGQTLLFALTTLVAVLVIACPCALGLATPTAVTVGIGRGAGLGILVRNGEALEAAGRVDLVVLDKTGTLTCGQPQVTEIVAADGDANGLLGLAAAVERDSLHPIADAVLRCARERGVDVPGCTAFEMTPGLGVQGEAGGRRVRLGNREFLAAAAVDVPAWLDAGASRCEASGQTVALVSADGRALGLLAVMDPPKRDAAAALDEFRRMGLEVALVTGDNPAAARAVASRLGIERVLAGVRPSGKAAEVRRLQAEGRVVAFVGDGTNDAPAMAQADLGVAIGGGTDVAVASGDIVLLSGSLRGAAAAIQLGRQVMRRVRQNLFWAFAYNLALVPLAAGLLVPVVGLKLPPALAGLAMALSSVTVVSLSLRLKRFRPPALSGGH